MPRNKYPEQTVEKILDAAALLFTQKGYQNTTLQDIIDATKLSKGAVYHHFRSKEEIAQRVGDRLGDQMWEPLRRIRDDPALTGLQKLQAVFAASFAGQRQQQIAQTLPHLCSNPQGGIAEQGDDLPEDDEEKGVHGNLLFFKIQTVGL